MGSRRRGREAALQMIYQIDVSGADPEAAIGDYWATLAASKEGESFANVIVRGWSSTRDKIDETLRGVSEHWRLERMSRVDIAILRLAVYELLSLSDVPHRVTLNEAIELAKRYGSEGSPSFVNGVLDRVATVSGKS